MRKPVEAATAQHRLIESVYEAALDETRWAGLAAEIAATFGSTSTTLQVQRRGSSAHILTMTDNVASGIDAYRNHFWQRDIWVERAIEHVGLSRVGASGDMVSEAEFERSEFYRDWCRHLEVFYVVGAVFPTGPGELGVLGIHRPRCAGTYDDEDKHAVARFLPHLQRALRIRERLMQSEQQRHVSLEALERCDCGVILVTADGSVRFANSEATRLIRRGAGIRVSEGRLTAGTREDADGLRRLIVGASGPRSEFAADGLLAIRRPGRRPLGLLVAPLQSAAGGTAAADVIVLVRDPDRPTTPLAALRAVHGLTATEAGIAAALMDGKALAEIAAEHGSKAATVRKQVKSLLAKTDTRRQAECVVLLLRSVAALARESASHAPRHGDRGSP